MNRRNCLKVSAGLLLAKLFGAVPVLAQSKTLVYGIVVDQDGNPVSGGSIAAWRKSGVGWTLSIEKVLQSHSWQIYLGKGIYKITYLRPGWIQDSVTPKEFTLPDAPPKGDVRIVVRKVALVPTGTVTPTPKPAVSATPTGKQCLDFQQFSWMERRDVVTNACMRIGQPLETDLDFDNDLTLLFGLRDLMLGAPLTPKFSVSDLICRGFAQAILVMRQGIADREECVPYGVVDYGGIQNWELD